MQDEGVEPRLDGIQVAMTATWSETKKTDGGGTEATTLTQRPRALMHQLIMGKIKGVPQRPELDALVSTRVHTPRLFGRAAATTVYPSGNVPEKSALSILSLKALDAKLRGDGRTGAAWGALDLEELLYAPVEKATRPNSKPELRPFKLVYTDPTRLASISKLGAAIFALLGAADDDVNSFAAVCDEAAGFLNRVLGVSERVDKVARRVAHRFVVGSIKEFGAAYDTARFGEDARQKMPAAFVQPMSEAAMQYAANKSIIERNIEEETIKQLAMSDDSDEEARAPPATPKTKQRGKGDGKDDDGDGGDGKTAEEYKISFGRLTVRNVTYDVGRAQREIPQLNARDGSVCAKHLFLSKLGVKSDAYKCHPFNHPLHKNTIEGFRPSEYRTDGKVSQRRPKRTPDDAVEGDDDAASEAAAAAAEAAAAKKKAKREKKAAKAAKDAKAGEVKRVGFTGA